MELKAKFFMKMSREKRQALIFRQGSVKVVALILTLTES